MIYEEKLTRKLSIPNGNGPAQQRRADIDFLTPDPYTINFLNIHIQSLSENFWKLVSDIRYPSVSECDTG